MLILAGKIARVRTLDFGFFAILYACQYVIHAMLAFGATDPITVFCIAFLIILLAFTRMPLRRTRASDALPSNARARMQIIEQRWIKAAKSYLLIYYLFRLALYPFAFGELFLDQRLDAQQENRVLFFMGLAVWPAIPALMYSWMRDQRRPGILDYIILLTVILGMLGSGSKAAVLPLLLSYIGVASYLNRRVLPSPTVVIGFCCFIALSFYLLTVFFPLLGPGEILSLLQYRIAADTDNLEYLVAIGQRPQDFPFSGIGALVPMFAKLVGYPFEFSAGVWLHGTRYGDWRGFGPNSGLVLDYFGNLGWSGLLTAATIGICLRRCRTANSAVGCSFLSIMYFALVDSALFSVPMAVWALIYWGITATAGIRLPQWPQLRLLSQRRRAATATLPQ